MDFVTTLAHLELVMQISRAVHAAEGLGVLAASSPGRPNTHCKMRSASAKPSCLKQILASPGGLGKSVLVVAPYFNRSFAAVFSLPRQSAKLLCTESTSSASIGPSLSRTSAGPGQRPNQPLTTTNAATAPLSVNGSKYLGTGQRNP